MKDEHEFLEDSILHSEDILALKQLEKDMYLDGDERSEIIRRILDILHIEEIIEDLYSPIITH